MLHLEPADVLALPLDELALLILADLVKTNEWNEYNYLNSYREDRSGRYPNNPNALQAVAEALTWLRARTFIARSPGQTADAAIFVTRRGHQALTQSVSQIHSMVRLETGLHPLIERQARRQILLGEYENAIFVSMKAVEIRVRQLAGFADDVSGLDLITKALRPGGPLADPTIPAAEVEGIMALFRGAYAVLRNPSGHREVSFEDPTEASEAVMTASLLMRMLDRIERRVSASGQT